MRNHPNISINNIFFNILSPIILCGNLTVKRPLRTAILLVPLYIYIYIYIYIFTNYQKISSKSGIGQKLNNFPGSRKDCCNVSPISSSISDFGVRTAILNTIDISRRWYKLNFGPLRGQFKGLNHVISLKAGKRESNVFTFYRNFLESLEKNDLDNSFG